VGGVAAGFSRSLDFTCCGSGVHQLTQGLRDGSANFIRGRNPFVNDNLYVLNRFLVARPVSHASGQLWHFSQKATIVFTPINHKFVTVLHIFTSPAYISKLSI
jgi:hypothetical protein